MKYWLFKSDPESYSWYDLKSERSTIWDGVRNYQARNYLKEMKKGDRILFYHSQSKKAVIGSAIITKEFFQDPTSHDESWVAVQIKPDTELHHPVALVDIKLNKSLNNIALVKQSRLSVMPLTKKEFDTIIKLGE